MARYSDDMPKWFIDAKELWKMLILQREKNKETSIAYTVNIGINQAVGLMNSLPAADVVEVIRCKDCEHFKPGLGAEGIKFCKRDKLGRSVFMRNDDFCSYGKRRTNDTTTDKT